MSKLQEVKAKDRIMWSVTIPEEKRKVLEKKGWTKGDHLDWNFNENGDLVLRKV